MIELSEHATVTPGGRSATFSVRPGTNDQNVVIALTSFGQVTTDEYHMAGRALEGWAIDVGAHVGAVAIPLALDHPDLRVLAVEAVPENVAILVRNASRNGVAGRVIIVAAAAAAPGTRSQVCHYGYRHDEAAADDYTYAHRFVAQTFMDRGNPEFAPTIEAVSLDTLLARYGIGEVALIKIDCEGCEWAFLDTPAVAKVAVIVGEYHGGITGVEHPRDRLVELLGATHDVRFWSDEPITGLFEAVRR